VLVKTVRKKDRVMCKLLGQIEKQYFSLSKETGHPHSERGAKGWRNYHVKKGKKSRGGKPGGRRGGKRKGPTERETSRSEKGSMERG